MKNPPSKPPRKGRPPCLPNLNPIPNESRQSSIRKKDLIKKTAAQVGLSDRKTGQVIASFLEIFSQELAKQGRISLKDFGTFQVIQRQAREVHHPSTGQVIQIPAKKRIRYSPGKGLEKQVNQTKPPGKRKQKIPARPPGA